MADMRIIVDTALTELPVNKHPLVDDTDFKSIEGAVAYNAAGLALTWHFVTTGGVYNNGVAVTPTTAGVHDWVDHGTHGVYTIEVPASGGTINNDTEGYGWFTGVATGILPWSSPIYEFVPANVANSLVNGTEWLECTTLRNDVTISGATITVKKTDGSTTQYTKTGTFTAGADVLTQLD